MVSARKNWLHYHIRPDMPGQLRQQGANAALNAGTSIGAKDGGYVNEQLALCRCGRWPEIKGSCPQAPAHDGLQPRDPWC
jgi:hypothetical protein